MFPAIAPRCKTRGRYIVKSNRCCKLISWVQCPIWLLTTSSAYAHSSITPQNQGRGECPLGSRGDHLAECWAGVQGSWLLPWVSRMALLGAHSNSHQLPAAGKVDPSWAVPEMELAGDGFAHHLPTWLQSCLPPTSWEETLVPSLKHPGNRLTRCSSLSSACMGKNHLRWQRWALPRACGSKLPSLKLYYWDSYCLRV